MSRQVLLILSVAIAGCVSAIPSSRFHERIVGGYPIDITTAPYQVALLDDNKEPFCGGSIISERFILTTAHCTKTRTADNLSIRLGSSNCERGGIVMNVTNIYQPELDYDLSLVELEEAISFNEAMQPIALPKPDESIPDGSILSTSGCGITLNHNDESHVLRQTEVPKYNDDACAEAYQLKDGEMAQWICAGFEEGGKDACMGDSGGPLVTEGKVLVGVTAWGTGCAKEGYPGVYARVTAALDWINEIIH